MIDWGRFIGPLDARTPAIHRLHDILAFGHWQVIHGRLWRREADTRSVDRLGDRPHFPPIAPFHEAGEWLKIKLWLASGRKRGG